MEGTFQNHALAPLSALQRLRICKVPRFRSVLNGLIGGVVYGPESVVRSQAFLPFCPLTSPPRNKATPVH
ncbi:hypothetical protein ANAPC5_01365 [Anaplasma phagocytophilum]|nr:hypothetical protein ANAPC5_01365 [Anaplasma phagocytophilum]